MPDLAPRKITRISTSTVISIGSFLLFGLAIVMRIYTLVSPHARDYDEGVYWESLRLMHGGSALYHQIYYSQPPLFLALAYPTYVAFGQTIFAARMSVALVSLVGLCGAYILGRAIAGQPGAFAALALTGRQCAVPADVADAASGSLFRKLYVPSNRPRRCRISRAFG